MDVFLNWSIVDAISMLISNFEHLYNKLNINSTKHKKINRSESLNWVLNDRILYFQYYCQQ